MTGNAVAQQDGASLVARDEVLAELDAALGRPLARGFKVALVTGDAGIGKSRLLTEVARRCAGEATQLSARAYRWGVTASFGLWVEALDRHLRSLDAGELRRLCKAGSSDLAALLNVVEAAVGTPAREPDRHSLLEALVELLDRLSGQSPLLITFDDVHLADASSWEALRYLGRRLADAPIGVVATCRPAELHRQPIATEVLLGLHADGLLHRRELSPLGRDDVVKLAHDVLRSDPRARSSFVPEPLAVWLTERSNGYPLFILGLLRALLEEDADPSAPRLERIPESLRERVLLEVQHLSDGARSVLETLAVVERGIDLADLGQIVSMEPDALCHDLEQLCTARLVTEHPLGPALRYEVAHPLLADAIYRDTSETRRRALHRAVARVLLDAGRLGSAAGHYAHAAEPGDDEAIDALCQAMRQAEARGLYQETLAALASLLQVLDAGDPRWLRVLDAMTWQAEWVLSHLVESDAGTAVTAMERIAAHVAHADHVVRGTVELHRAAFLAIGAGQLAEAEQACRAAVSAFEAAGDCEQALLSRNELAWIRGCGTDLAEQVTLADAVADEAVRSGNVRAAVQAAGTAAYALGCRGRFAEAEERYIRSIELARHAGESYRAAWGLAQRAQTLAYAGRLQDALASVRAALEEDSAAPDAIALEYLAQCHWLAGHLDEAVAVLEQSTARRPVRGSRRRAWGAALAARLYAEQGLRGKADGNLEQARATYQDGPIFVWSCWHDWTAGVLAWWDGDPGRGLDALDRAAAQVRDIGAPATEALVLVDAAEAAEAAGEPARAERAAMRLASTAEEIQGGLIPHLAQLAVAWSALAAARHAEAAAVAERAAEGLSGGGYALLGGSALEAQGRALVRDDRREALRLLIAAANVFSDSGATRRRDAVLSKLTRLGTPGRRAAAALHGPEALTERERDVAGLAAKGLTAQEIGERLFISRRTVESHLANAYLKVGVTSKRELIRRAEDVGL